MTDYEEMKQLFIKLGIYFDEYKNSNEIFQKHDEYYILHYFSRDGKYRGSMAGKNI